MRVEGFGDAIGIKSEGVAGVELAFFHVALPLLKSAENGGGGAEAVKGVISAQQQGGKMAAVDVTQAAGCVVVLGEEKRGEGTAGSVLAEKLIHGAEESLGLIQCDRRLAAQIRLQIGHQQSRRDAFSGNVADHQTQTFAAQIEEIVIIAANLPCLVANPR